MPFPTLQTIDAPGLAYKAAQQIRDMGPDKGTMLSVPFEGMCDVIAEAIANAFLAGVEVAYDECGVIRGEDATRILDQLETPLDPERVKAMTEKSRAWSEWIQKDPKTRGPEPK